MNQHWKIVVSDLGYLLFKLLDGSGLTYQLTFMAQGWLRFSLLGVDHAIRMP
ncbi:hypothetical protein VCR15J2_470799 [Vibrio coralliirubri]|nr:hypothetical protein VCR15J2_470799 [Vibrio coralliirubri]